jgi:hypothetical protein
MRGGEEAKRRGCADARMRVSPRIGRGRGADKRGCGYPPELGGAGGPTSAEAGVIVRRSVLVRFSVLLLIAAGLEPVARMLTNERSQSQLVHATRTTQYDHPQCMLLRRRAAKIMSQWIHVTRRA